MKRIIFAIFASVFSVVVCATPALATVDPLGTTNNKFGVHIITVSPDEINPASDMVNSNGGDWGYITFLIERSQRDQARWQEVFNTLRKKHLIPIVRIATEPKDGGFWDRPTENEAQEWADFLNSLLWPTQNRYVIVYNEPNQGKEWGNSVDPTDYAHNLDQTITALKNKSSDFFVLNAGFDASAPQKPPQYYDEGSYLKAMNEAVPGIFNKIDGWVSHSYPNPGFVGSPSDAGRGSIRTYQWELNYLKQLGVTRTLPVFITETGWRHAEGINYNASLPNSQVVANYYKQAFENAWDDNKIVAVTPFLLNYQEPPFDHFSFKKMTGATQEDKILGTSTEEYYPAYKTITDISKPKGVPKQLFLAQKTQGEIYTSVVAGETYTLNLTFKNVGQSIWNDGNDVELTAVQGGKEVGIDKVAIVDGVKVEPNGEYTFSVPMKAPLSGTVALQLNLTHNDVPFDSPPVEAMIQVKSPVILQVLSNLKWKGSSEGDYRLEIAGQPSNTEVAVHMDNSGMSQPMEARYLLPDYTFQFTLKRQFYQPKTISKKVVSGVNTLDFGELQPDITAAILRPTILWRLLPISSASP
jgi:hypothetical protein